MSRALIAVLLLAAAFNTVCAESPGAESPQLKQAHQLLGRHVLIDGHNDVPWQVRERFDRRVGELDFAGDTAKLEPPMHTDLIRRGYGDEELAAIAGGNMLRVLRDAEAVSDRLRSERGPSQVRYE